MTEIQPSVRASTTRAWGQGVMIACARSAAAITGGTLAVAHLDREGPHWWGRNESDRPSPTGPAVTRLLPAIQARIGGPVVLRDLADSPIAAGLSTSDLEGLASAALVPVVDPAGRPVGLVGAFDRSIRSWHDDDVQHLTSVAALVSARYQSLERLASSRAVARAAFDLELCLTSGRIQALVDEASAATDPTLQRRASEAHTAIEEAGVIAGRLRSFLRAQSPVDGAGRQFDLVVVVGRAVSEAARMMGLPAPHLYGLESSLPVAGEVMSAHSSILRAICAALAVAEPDDTTVMTATRGAHLGTLDGSVVAEVVIDVRGVGLGAAELSRIAAGRVANGHRVSGATPPASLNISVAGDEVRLVGPGVEAVSTADATRIALSWSVDLG